MGLVLDIHICLRNAKIIQSFFKKGKILLENKKASAIHLVNLIKSLVLIALPRLTAHHASLDTGEVLHGVVSIYERPVGVVFVVTALEQSPTARRGVVGVGVGTRRTTVSVVMSYGKNSLLLSYIIISWLLFTS